MQLCCQQDTRRDAVRRKLNWNGLDYVEVGEGQTSLIVYFLGKLPAEFTSYGPETALQYLKLTGGVRVTGIRVIGLDAHANESLEADDYLVLYLDKYGDFSTYTLSLVGIANIDPRYQSVDFSFKVDCPSDLDCAPPCGCEPPIRVEPEINYLAKDYASFRQLILDRLAVLLPDWTERHVPDLGITLVELLAYTGDYLSYYQDAVATEAYLSTARQRISVRRHVRLVDYVLHEGCNSRAWVSVEVSPDIPPLAVSELAFITGLDGVLPTGNAVLGWDDLRNIPASSYEVFEPLLAIPSTEISFSVGRSKISFYTWGEKECCLAKGSTSATLLDSWGSGDKPTRGLASLKPGDVLILEEVKGPKTGLPEDADPLRRHAVRLTQVTPGIDKVAPTKEGKPRPIVEIAWAVQDALPFTFCLSARGQAPACQYIEDISIARGNVLLVDLGKSIDIECLGEVQETSSQASCECDGLPGEILHIPKRFHPHLSKAPLTFSVPLPLDALKRSAAATLLQDERAALPRLRLYSLAAKWRKFFDTTDLCSLTSLIAIVDDASGVWLQFPKGRLPGPLADYFADAKLPATRWDVRYDLLESEPDDTHFVVEIDNDGVARLRFGDGVTGAQPEAGAVFFAAYRHGNGAVGNVGAEAISLMVLKNVKLNGVVSVRNPLPAVGGSESEPIAEAKLYAPTTFRKRIERAITADDYRLLAERDGKLQRASAELRWTGSWYEAAVAVDPLGTEIADSGLLKTVDGELHPFRRMGHDLRVLAAHYVPIELTLEVCVRPHYQQAHVKAALLEVFSNRRLANGKRGFFHPDNLSFGDGIDVSKLIAAGMAVTGVECVRVTGLNRRFEAANGELEAGLLALSLHEIAQLDNDPNYPEHGTLKLVMSGGR